MAGKGKGRVVQRSTNSRILRRSSNSCSVVVVAARTAWKVGGSTTLRAGLRGLAAAANGFDFSISIISRKRRKSDVVIPARELGC